MYTTKPAAERAYAAYRAQLQSATTELAMLQNAVVDLAIRGVSHATKPMGVVAPTRKALVWIQDTIIDLAAQGKKKVGPGPGWWGPPKGTHAVAYNPSKDSVQKAGAIVDRKITKYAEKQGLNPKQVEYYCQKAVKDLVAQPLSCRHSAGGAAGIVESGRFKTQFETGESGGQFDLDYRKKAELQGLGVPLDISSEKRPVYAYFDTPGHEAADYGAVEFQFRDSVKDRTTIALTDSLESFARGELVGRPANNPTKECWASDIGLLYTQGKIDTSYVEGHIHGGVSLKDVGKVIFHRGAYGRKGRLLPEYRAIETTLKDQKMEIGYAPKSD